MRVMRWVLAAAFLFAAAAAAGERSGVDLGLGGFFNDYGQDGFGRLEVYFGLGPYITLGPELVMSTQETMWWATVGGQLRGYFANRDKKVYLPYVMVAFGSGFTPAGGGSGTELWAGAGLDYNNPRSKFTPYADLGWMRVRDAGIDGFYAEIGCRLGAF